MKLITLILFSTLAACAQSPRTHQDLPAAPSTQQPTLSDIHLTHKTMTENPRGRGLGKMAKEPLLDGANHPARNVIEVKDVKEGFWRGHPTRTKVIIAAIGGGVGLTIALVTRHNCPNFYLDHGKKEPYNGTPPCPGPDYDPMDKRSVGLRWRF